MAYTGYIRLSLIGTPGLQPDGNSVTALRSVVSAARWMRRIAFMPSLGSTAIDARKRSGCFWMASYWMPDSSPNPIMPVSRAAAPVIVEGPRLGLGSGSGTWPLSQAALVGLMIVAFAVVLIARISTPGAATPSPSPSPIATASPSPSPTPTPIATPTVAPSGSGAVPSGSGALPSAAASQAGAASGPAFGTTYRVKAGDTLVGIASTFGTTVGELQRVNRLAGSDLRIGQLVRIP